MLAIAGCASSTQPRAVAPTPEQISAPLNVCAPTDTPPQDVASQEGYLQYSVIVIDATGNPARDLKQSDFTAYAGGQS